MVLCAEKSGMCGNTGIPSDDDAMAGEKQGLSLKLNYRTSTEPNNAFPNSNFTRSGAFTSTEINDM